jgi:hypothetical protein
MSSRKQRRYTRCAFVPASHRENVPAGVTIYDVSSYADYPFCTLSPMWEHGGIPVPGLSGVTSDSVEGIWQGLKVIRGKIAPHLFRGKGQKRGGKPAGHQFGDRLLDVVAAREKVYRPSYEWMLANRVDPALIAMFLDRAFAGVQQLFHDLGDNGNMHNREQGWCHAAVLVQYLNRRCVDRATVLHKR